MPTTDRRHSPRVQLDQLAYLNIEPDNGGIVLNVSEGGLCFRSMGMIESESPLRLSLQESNRKIDIPGELVWTDEVKKCGGVRFSTLTKEARGRISDWTLNSEPPPKAGTTLGAALLKALPSPEARRIARSVGPAMAWWKSGRRVKISGFTRGLAAGFLLSLIAFLVVFFSYQHRADFGESLIRIGKRLAGKQDAEKAPGPTPAPQPITAAASPRSTPAVIPTEAKFPIKSPSHDASPHATGEADDVTVRWLTSSRQGKISLTPEPRAQKVTPEATLTASKGPESEANSQSLPIAQPANPSVPTFSATERSVSISKPVPLASSLYSEVVPSLNRSSIISKVQMFFDLGRFKREPMAQSLREKIAELGIESSVVPKRRIFGNSFQVLAGPYDDDHAEKQISTVLLSHGYQPRPFERGTRDFAFHSRLTIDGAPLPTGNFTIAWESYIADAKVRFSQNNGLLVAADGKWVKRAAKFNQNEYVYQLQPDGSRPLLELHFGGMDRALVFRRGQP